MELNWADFAVIAIIVLSTLISLIRGFIKEAVSLATWVVAIWLAVFHDGGALRQPIASLFVEFIELWWLRELIAGFIILIVVLIVGAVINYIISQLVDKTGFSGTDRTLGAVFGVLRGGLVVALVIMLLGLTPIPQDQWWKESYLLPKFQDKITLYKAYLPEDIARHFNFNRAEEPVQPANPTDEQSVPAVAEPDVSTVSTTSSI